MGISKEEAIKELQTREEIFVAYSQATKLPYVKCDEETFNDQAWIFSTEEGIKELGKKMLEEKVLLMGMKFTKKDYPRLYGTFYAIGVNTVVWVDGEDKIEIDLPDIAKQADMSKIEPAKRPLLNPTLELSGIYFMQELRRPVEKDQHGNLRELEEELIVNLKKSEYLKILRRSIFRISKIKKKKFSSLYLQTLWNLRSLQKVRSCVLRKYRLQNFRSC